MDPVNAELSAARFGIRQMMPESSYQQIRSALLAEPFRRLTHDRETQVPIDMLCQSLHVGAATGQSRAMLGGRTTTYYQHSLASVGQEVDELLALGIRDVYLQLYPTEDRGTAAAVEHHAVAVGRLRERYGNDLTLSVDTAGFCMGTDLRWGVRGADGAVDPELTLDVLADGVRQVAQAGADVVVTVGRVNFEALVARRAMDSIRPGIELWAFSTNSETPNAYFDMTALDPGRALTGQKLLVGNGSEMVLRALRDCHEGVDVLIQKPVENHTILRELRSVADGELALADFKARPAVRKLIDANPELFADGLCDGEVGGRRLASVGLGAYEVSGTYAIFRHIEDAYSTALALAMLDEMWANTLWAAGDRGRVIISRQANWYARHRREIGG